MRLKDKAVILTGANSGVGKAVALRFAEEGARLVLCARRKEALQAVADEIAAKGGKAVAVAGDVSKPETSNAVANACMEEYGQIDVLVNCAGVNVPVISSLDKCVEDEQLDWILDINTKGPFYMMRAVLPKMLEAQRGAIVNVASVAGSNGLGDARYAASKGAVIALTKHVAVMSSQKGVRCNAICPATIVTPMIEANMRGEGMDMETLAAMGSHANPNVPVNMPEDIAATLLFLASDESRNITGQAIVCDFGYSL